jgi:hypothetical protein
MLFSYGFLDEGDDVATALSLTLEIPDDDPLKKAKETVSTVASAIRISLEDDGRTNWESAAIWLSCVNEEDGLDFRILQTNTGERELKMLFKDQDITQDTSQLSSLLKEDPLWDIFQLRAVATAQGRVAEQLQRLERSENSVQAARTLDSVDEHVWQLAVKLRRLESELLLRAYGDMEDQVRSSPY